MKEAPVRRLAQIVEGAGARLYDHRHPGPLARAIIAGLGPLVLRSTPNDKWNLHVFIPEWLGALRNPVQEPLPRPKRIFLFCAYRIEFTLNLNLATLLAWRGHRVTIGYLPKLQSPIKEPRRDHWSARPYLLAALKDVERLSGGQIRCVELGEATAAATPVDEAFIARQVRADLMMVTRREALDVNDPEVRENLAYYEDLGHRAQRAAWAHFLAHRDDYDLCLIPNGTTFEGAHFCRVAKAVGLPVNTFEKFAFKKVRAIDHGDHCMAFDDLDLLWNLRQAAGYETEPFYSRACTRAMALLEEHRAGVTRNWAFRLQTAAPQSAEGVRAALGLRNVEPFVLVCPNVPFDAGYMELTTVFPTMRAWLVETVSFLLRETPSTVVVRAHPAEALHWGTRERSADILEEARLPSERLVVVPGDAGVNTYGLIDACRFGVVFSSTVGLEMAMLGRSVLVGSHIYYTRRGFSVDVEDRARYFAELARLARGPVGLSPEQTRQARLFYYLLHFVWQRPYPYDKPSCIRRFPPAKLLADGRIVRYVETLDALTMDPQEWRDYAKQWLCAEHDRHLEGRDDDEC